MTSATTLIKRPTVFSALFSPLIKPLRSPSGGDDLSVAVDRRPDRRPSIFPDVFDPFSLTRSPSQVLNLVDQFMDTSFFPGGVAMGAPSRRGWDVREEDDALYMRIDMPGLGKDDVRVSVEQNTLIIRGESKKEE